MAPLFWTAILLDAVLLVVLLVLTLAGTGHSDGGREMALVFYVIIPALVAVGGALLFLKSTSPARGSVRVPR